MQQLGSSTSRERQRLVIDECPEDPSREMGLHGLSKASSAAQLTDLKNRLERFTVGCGCREAGIGGIGW